MDWQIIAWGRLLNAVAGSLLVLAVGSLAALTCRQPVRRARLVLLTLLGGLTVPLLGAFSIVPRWSTGLLAAPVPSSLRDTEGTASTSSITARPAIAPGLGRAGDLLGSAAEAPTEAAVAARGGIGLVEAELPRRWVRPATQTIVLGAYAAVTAGLSAWWCFGQVLLWRITRASRPVPAAVRDVFLGLAGPAGARVLLVESDRIALPFTYTWVGPVILMPTALCERVEPGALRYVLAHEWSHVERRDAWAWNLACLAGLVFFYQPLFWWLRRQLRLCQDYLADARAAAAGSAEDYAAFLVGLARVQGARPRVPALGIVDRRSNLHRRVVMLVQDHEPLEQRCRRAWSLATAALALAVIVVASGLRLDAAAAADGKPDAKEARAAQDAAKASETTKPAEGALHYTGTVNNKDTGGPVAGATVVVRRSILRSQDKRVLQETRHTTAADGTYAFTIPPEQVAEHYLYIELDVEHPDYATRAGFGYALGMTRKNEGLGERPFFETIELRPAEPITGRVETAAARAAAGVELLAYSRTNRLPSGEFEYGSFAKAKTDPDGKFRLPITTPGRGVFWVLPKSYAPELHVLPDGKRGDVGTITLKQGVTVTGRLFDVQGKPVAGVFIEADRERGSAPEFEVLDQLMVSDAIRRGAETDSEGRFTFDPLPPGAFLVKPTEFNDSGDPSAGRRRRELPGVFAEMKLTIKEGEVPTPLEVRATPHVLLEGQWLDSKGQPKSGWGSFVFGRIDGAGWQSMTHPDDQGRFSLKVPHGIENAQLDISTNEHASARHRLGKDKPLVAGRHLMLETLDHDVKGIEIVRYVAPILVINATNRDGKQIEGFKATVEYTAPDENFEKNVHVVGGGKTKAIQDEQYDGRYRTSTLLPDSEVNVTVKASGFAEASRKFKLPEGKTEEVNFVLEPK